jgi:hypothetical protein
MIQHRNANRLAVRAVLLSQAGRLQPLQHKLGHWLTNLWYIAYAFLQFQKVEFPRLYSYRILNTKIFKFPSRISNNIWSDSKCSPYYLLPSVLIHHHNHLFILRIVWYTVKGRYKRIMKNNKSNGMEACLVRMLIQNVDGTRSWFIIHDQLIQHRSYL